MKKWSLLMAGLGGGVVLTVLLLLAAVGQLFTASPAQADHVAGAMYTGTHAGGTVTFSVSDDGATVSSFSYTVSSSTCAAAGATGNIPIVNHSFSYEGPAVRGPAIFITGSFPSPGEAKGKLAFQPEMCGFETLSWTATTAGAPTPTPTPPADLPIVAQVASCSAVESLFGFRNDTKQFTAFAAAAPAASDLTAMVLGGGYWAKTSGDCTLAYGSSSHDLYDDWNLIGWQESDMTAASLGDGIRAAQAGPPIVDQLGSCAGQVTSVWGYDNQAKRFLPFSAAAPAASDLQQMTAGGGYWVDIDSDCDLATPTTTHKLYDGWNLIGWVD